MKFNSVGATALAAAASLTPVLAQVDIEDLGYCARFYWTKIVKRETGQSVHRWRLLSRRSADG